MSSDLASFYKRMFIDCIWFSCSSIQLEYSLHTGVSDVKAKIQLNKFIHSAYETYLPVMEVLCYGALNAVIQSKYATE